MRRLILATAAAALFLSACGTDEPEAAEPCADPVTVTSVVMGQGSSGYEPDCLSVAAGATIALRNSGISVHSFTIDGTDVNYSVSVGNSSDADLSSLDPGIYAVRCIYHSPMHATLTVE